MLFRASGSMLGSGSVVLEEVGSPSLVLSSYCIAAWGFTALSPSHHLLLGAWPFLFGSKEKEGGGCDQKEQLAAEACSLGCLPETSMTPVG